jgi:bifunctional non-homologous end joining protein LigD
MFEKGTNQRKFWESMTQSNRGNTRQVWTLGERKVAVSNLEKIFWPDDGITKGDLLAYYRDLGATLLPYIAERPLVMKPYPDGIAGSHYFRQNLPEHAPEWLDRFETMPLTEHRVKQMPVANDLASLIWVVNQAAIELHPWLSRTSSPEHPDLAVFDLDVASIDRFPLALEVALLVRRELSNLGLDSYPKTSGSHGLHIYVPLDGRDAFDVTHAWARNIAERIEQRRADLVTTDAAKAGRADRVLVDYAQNSFGKTTVAPYSVRPTPGARVSAPLSWDEVETHEVRPQDFTLRSMQKRLERNGDLFSGLFSVRQHLPDL